MSESTKQDAAVESHHLGDLAKYGKLAPPVAVAGFVLLAAIATLFPGSGAEKLRVFGLGYLTGFSFVLSISLGAMFFVIIHHLTRAGWSVVVRRLAEHMAANIKYVAVMAFPLVLLLPYVYDAWINPNSPYVGNHALIEWKSPWLNFPFFVIRLFVYFVVWISIAHWFRTISIEQDETGDHQRTLDMQKWSGLAIVLYALTVSFASVDLLMSIAPEWYSTIFGVYYFAGSMLIFFSFMILSIRCLQSHGVLSQSINVEHFHDLGKYLFGFVIFWAYIAYSQYMLQWYGAIPEEVAWFARRGAETYPEYAAGNPWQLWALLLLFCHFLIPFPGLISRWAKRWLGVLTFWAVWLAIFHFVDLYWVVMPEQPVESFGGTIGLLVAALGGTIGCLGLWMAGLFHLASESSLIPEKDPRLGESLAFENY